MNITRSLATANRRLIIGSDQKFRRPVIADFVRDGGVIIRPFDWLSHLPQGERVPKPYI